MSLHSVRNRLATARSTLGRVRGFADAAYASVFLCCVSIFWLFLLIRRVSADVAANEIPAIVLYCLAAVAIQAIVLLAVRRIVPVFFAAFALLNTYSLYFVFSADLVVRSFLMQGAMLLGIAALYFVAFRILSEQRRVRRWAAAAVTVGVAVFGLVAVAPVIAGPGAGDEPVSPGAAFVHPVEFERTPNVYILGFDGMTPPVLSGKFFQEPSPAYARVIADFGGAVLPNLFADQVPTKRFWGATINLIPEGMGAVQMLDEAVLGFAPAPLLTAFQQNGYRTHFYYASAYFGANHGRYIDRYRYLEPYSICSFLDELPRRRGMLGYCRLQPLFVPSSAELNAMRDDFYLRNLETATRARQGDPSAPPQLFMAHYPRPNHTSGRYRNTPEDLAAFRTRFAQRSNEAADMMTRMLEEIRQNDPEAIVFVVGDHGSYISRGLEYDDDREFVVQDRHGVLGAVFGGEACAPFLQPPEGARTRTFSYVMVGLITCLSGGESPLVEDYDFGAVRRAPADLRFEDFAYE